ncbi:3-hydroxyacyl-ACP dehydratase [Dyadobacter bucti]|uniref:3-hydroxyacyl-ACP dehydratase n=1 Tax=Dyadobacter bucti TaxID=2572203 RepID=UPI0011099769|nr:3-hydroxyacyl-ACP dehydratase [Dyadobacter bucti]
MFLNDLYTITETDSSAGQINSEIKINGGHRLFKGHFPGEPVTPGVVQLQIVKEILEAHLQKKLSMKSLRVCKFLSILNPEITPVVQIRINYKQAEMLEVASSGEFGETVFFKAQTSYL